MQVDKKKEKETCECVNECVCSSLLETCISIDIYFWFYDEDQ